METRCSSCNKLFRVADEKITGSGIKFKCTRCGEYVKITKEDFEQYTLSKAATSVLATFEPTAPKPVPEAAEPEASGHELGAAVPGKGSAHPLPPAAEAPRAETAPPEMKPAPAPEPAARPAPETKPVTESGPEPVRPSAPAAPRPEPAPSPTRPASPAAEIISAEPVAPVSSGKKYLILVLLVFILCAAGYGVFLYMRSTSKSAGEAVKGMTSPEGLQIATASGSLEPNGDLLISGVIENTTDKERPAWYVVVDVYDAQGAVLMRARMLNGKQLYTKKDYEVLAKRGVNVQELKAKGLQEPGVVIPPKGSVSFEIRFMEPPVGIASFNATLQPFDPEQLFKEIAEDMKQ
jgi:predicted Zn finger-like uncharacterized protein